MIPHDISTPRLTLSSMSEGFVSDRYLGWMSSPEVTEFTESRFARPTLDGLVAFVRSTRESPNSYMFAIVETASGEHIGNVKLGPVNEHHRRAAIGIIIGESGAWGRGYATEAVRAVSEWAFNELGLGKLIAGIYAANVGSIRAFEKAGFVIEGRQVAEVVLADGTRGDALILGRVAS